MPTHEFTGKGRVIYTRRELLKTVMCGAIAMVMPGREAAVATETFISKRPPVGQRKFVSRAIEETIVRVKSRIGDPELAWMFENCYPNTLDTTVEFSAAGGTFDTFIITGDIDAMWLRDSACQAWPYGHAWHAESRRPSHQIDIPGNDEGVYCSTRRRKFHGRVQCVG